MEYQFNEIKPNLLFLTLAIFREYIKNTDTISKGELYFFKQDGSLTIETQDIQSKETHIKHSKIDVTGNYSRFPNFGEYSDLIRLERN